MPMFRPMPPCHEKHCNNHRRGVCIALSDTDFKGLCPFFLDWRYTPESDIKYHVSDEDRVVKNGEVNHG